MGDNFTSRRAPGAGVPTAIDKQVYRWWATLPEKQRPVQLAKAFPRIVNQIAAYWATPQRCAAYLNALVVDPQRNDRQGFPYAIALEILALQTLLSESDPSIVTRPDEDFKFGGA